jgi:cell division protein ZapA (FtsZ GTPase activity inhibitor)
MSKKSVAVRIAGHEYKIRSESDGKVLREIALYVDQTMERVRKETGTVDSLDVAVLACLNLGRENLALKNQQAEVASDASLRSLIERVEAHIPGLSEQDDSGQAVDAASQVDQTEKSSSNTKTSKAEPAQAPAKTLDLPSVENLHERSATDSTSSSDSSNEEDVLPEARVAAGGRDRAS